MGALVDGSPRICHYRAHDLAPILSHRAAYTGHAKKRFPISLEAGLSQEQIHILMVENPKSALTGI